MPLNRISLKSISRSSSTARNPSISPANSRDCFRSNNACWSSSGHFIIRSSWSYLSSQSAAVSRSHGKQKDQNSFPGSSPPPVPAGYWGNVVREHPVWRQDQDIGGGKVSLPVMVQKIGDPVKGDGSLPASRRPWITRISSPGVADDLILLLLDGADNVFQLPHPRCCPAPCFRISSSILVSLSNPYTIFRDGSYTATFRIFPHRQLRRVPHKKQAPGRNHRTGC